MSGTAPTPPRRRRRGQPTTVAVPPSYDVVQSQENSSTVPRIPGRGIAVGAQMVPAPPRGTFSAQTAPEPIMSTPTRAELVTNPISTFVPGTLATSTGPDGNTSIATGNGQPVGSIPEGAPGYEQYMSSAAPVARAVDGAAPGSQLTPTHFDAVSGRVVNGPMGARPRDVSPFRQGQETVRQPGRGGGGASASTSSIQDTQTQAGPNPFDTLANAGQRRADIAADSAAAQGRILEQQNAEQQAAEQERQQRMQQAEEGISRRISEVENMRIDPNNWFSSRGVVGSIGAALAVGLGAAAQSLQGNGPNNALGIINNAIDRDIAAQTENLRNAGMRLTNRENGLARLRQHFGDDRAAEEAFRGRTLAVAAQQAEEMRLRASNPDSQERLAQMQAILMEAQQQSNIRVRERLVVQHDAQANAARVAARSRAAAASRATRGPVATKSAVDLMNQVEDGLRARGLSPEQARAVTVRQGIAPRGFEDVRINADTRTQQERTASAESQTQASEYARAGEGLRGVMNDYNSGQSVGGVGFVPNLLSESPVARGVVSMAQQYLPGGQYLEDGVGPIPGIGNVTPDSRLAAAQQIINIINHDEMGANFTEMDKANAARAGRALQMPGLTADQQMQNFAILEQIFSRGEERARAGGARPGPTQSSPDPAEE